MGKKFPHRFTCIFLPNETLFNEWVFWPPKLFAKSRLHCNGCLQKFYKVKFISLKLKGQNSCTKTGIYTHFSSKAYKKNSSTKIENITWQDITFYILFDVFWYTVNEYEKKNEFLSILERLLVIKQGILLGLAEFFSY